MPRTFPPNQKRFFNMGFKLFLRATINPAEMRYDFVII